ncbi:unnamed protein product [Gordionus sp. m RMFG-2023]
MTDTNSQIKVKVAYNGDILVTYIDQFMNIDTLNKEMVDICHFSDSKPFTMKWIDDEGDPCMLTNQKELDEALRLYELNEDNDMTIHVFSGKPEAPGCLCPGEDKSVYRRGAKRWRKLYRINGHLFQLKRFSRKAICVLCSDRIWGLGRQGLKCLNCKLLIHKKCHKFVKITCTNANFSWQSIENNTNNGGSILSESNVQIFDKEEYFDTRDTGLTFIQKEHMEEETIDKWHKNDNNKIGLMGVDQPYAKKKMSFDSALHHVDANNFVFDKIRADYKVNDNGLSKTNKISTTNYVDKVGTPGKSKNCIKNGVNSNLKNYSKPLLKDISQEFPIITSGMNGSGKKFNKTEKAIPSSQTSKMKILSSDNGLVYSPSIVGEIDTSLADSKSKKKRYKLSDFELMKVIGRGSYAKVFLAELKDTKKVYAMKVIKKELINDEEDIDWVQTEKHVFETATNHPFLVGLHSCFQTPSRLIFVIEFVNGGDLMFHMQRQRRLPEEHSRFYSAEIILALNFLHRKGIIYRDLKLDNVLLDCDGHIRLTDYGMCKEGLNVGDRTSTFCGTPNYIAPEILRGDDYSFSVDWWALGVLMFEMLAGRSPFDIVGATDNPDHNTEDYLFQVILEKTIRIPRSISVKAASVLKGFLNKDPVERLGCHPETGFKDIIMHCFFKTIDWDMLESKQLTPPYKPKLSNDRAVDNFDPQFTNELPILTPDDQTVLDRIDQTEFEGFEFVNPLLNIFDQLK